MSDPFTAAVKATREIQAARVRALGHVEPVIVEGGAGMIDPVGVESRLRAAILDLEQAVIVFGKMKGKWPSSSDYEKAAAEARARMAAS